MSTTIYVNSTWKSGEKVTIDGVEYTIVSQSDVLAVIE